MLENYKNYFHFLSLSQCNAPIWAYIWPIRIFFMKKLKVILKSSFVLEACQSSPDGYSSSCHAVLTLSGRRDVTRWRSGM